MSAVLTDFDGTIAEQDLAERVLERFAAPSWEQFNRLQAEGKINVEECVTRQYAMIRAKSLEEIIEYTRRFARFRPGFKDLVSECSLRGVRIFVVSAGLDFCIRDAFRATGLDLPELICPKSSFEPLGGIHLRFPPHEYPASRDFKEDAVLNCKAHGFRVIYVGDGSGDINAAERADKVFTMDGSTLDRMCTDRGIPHESITRFDPVIQHLSRRPS